MMDNLLAWRVFLSLYDTLSVQRTAAELDIDPSVVSRSIANLEKKQRCRYFVRDVRPFQRTADAEAIVFYVRNMLYQRERIDRYQQSKQEDGKLVITVMIANTYRTFAPSVVEEYLKQNPDLRFNMVSPIDVPDFLAGKADILGSGTGRDELPSCQLLSRGTMTYLPVASPHYIKRHGMPHSPDDLKKHRIFRNLYRSRYGFQNEFPLIREGRVASFKAVENVRWANADVVKEAVLEGFGIGISLPLFCCIDELEKGLLVPVLDGWHRSSEPGFVACKDDDWKIKSIRLFATYLAKVMQHYQDECQERFSRLYGEKQLQLLREAL